MRGERPVIDGTDGTNVLEVLHVRDMAAGYLAVAEKLEEGASGEAFNFGSGVPLSLLDLVRAITRSWNQLSGNEIPEDPIVTGPHIKSTKYLDIAKARNMLDWAPEIKLEDGLRETIEWYREHYALCA